MMNLKQSLLAAGFAGSVTFLAACGGGDSSQRALSPEAIAEAEGLFKTVCVACHGESGQGDGPGSAALNPKPRNYTDRAWQKQVDDEYLGKIIVYGGAAVGKSVTMPGNPQLGSKPEVVSALVAKIRSFGN